MRCECSLLYCQHHPPLLLKASSWLGSSPTPGPILSAPCVTPGTEMSAQPVEVLKRVLMLFQDH